MRKLKIVSEVLKLGTQEYYKDDVKSFPDEEAAEYVRLGWAQDVETGELGERKPGVSKLHVHTAKTTNPVS